MIGAILGKLPGYLTALLLGVIVILGIGFKLQSDHASKLGKQVSALEVESAAKEKKIQELKNSILIAQKAEDQSKAVKERLVTERVYVAAKPQTSSCGPAVDAAVDILRDH